MRKGKTGRETCREYRTRRPKERVKDRKIDRKRRKIQEGGR